MIRKTFDIKALGGLLKRETVDEAGVRLQRVISIGARWEQLQQSEDWPILDSLLMEMQTGAVQDMAKKCDTFDDTQFTMQRLNNRLETLADIRSHIRTMIRAGKVAHEQLTKMQEKENGNG